jgi:hypothetical protein
MNPSMNMPQPIQSDLKPLPVKRKLSGKQIHRLALLLACRKEVSKRKLERAMVAANMIAGGKEANSANLPTSLPSQSRGDA